MSDGLSWAANHKKSIEAYRRHVSDGKFNKEYLEGDIVRSCTKEEVRLLVVRLIIHHLGGWKKFLKEEGNAGLNELFRVRSKAAKKRFLEYHARELGLEIGQTKKLDKLRKQVRALQAAIFN